MATLFPANIPYEIYEHILNFLPNYELFLLYAQSNPGSDSCLEILVNKRLYKKDIFLISDDVVKTDCVKLFQLMELYNPGFNMFYCCIRRAAKYQSYNIFDYLMIYSNYKSLECNNDTLK